MDDRGRLRPGGGGEPKLPTLAVQMEHDREVRQVRREPGDPVTSTHVRKEDLSDVPRKVPRFQYVDFPSLHQCIKQLSVPPLEGWLASCPLVRVPSCQPSSPKEKVPKFKYVDYPSLYHCIQQLSVPPLEIWSSGLTRPGSGELRGAPPGQSPSQMPVYSREIHQELCKTGAKQQNRKSKNPRVPAISSEIAKNACTELEETTQRPSGSGSDSGSRSEPNQMATRNERPSVISMVRTERRKRSPEPDERSKRQRSLDPVSQSKQETVPELVCPFCQQMFTDPEELRTHQRSHKEKVSEFGSRCMLSRHHWTKFTTLYVVV